MALAAIHINFINASVWPWLSLIDHHNYGELDYEKLKWTKVFILYEDTLTRGYKRIVCVRYFIIGHASSPCLVGTRHHY